MNRALELTGQRFGKLTVIKRNGSKNSKAYWLCQCDCGNQVSVVSNALSGNKTRSCGCISIERIRNQNKGKSLVQDIVGNRYGRLVVTEFSHLSDDRKRTYWKCKCDCGAEITTRGDGLKSGHTNSCGCYNRDLVSQTKGATTHGLSDGRIYGIYSGMIQRCYNPNNTSYKRYGGRGITICQEWLDDFMNFYNWSMANGYQDDLSIDRIDFNGNYEPSNCRWATSQEQSNNTSRNLYITYKGETKSLKQWCNDLDIPYKTAHYKIRKGFAPENVFLELQETT